MQVAESALADEWVRNGDRLSLQKRVLRLGKPPRRWKKPSWARTLCLEPCEVVIPGRALNSGVGSKNRCAFAAYCRNFS